MASVELNITDPAGIAQVAEKLIADFPKLNVLINNAGIMQPDDASTVIDDALLTSIVTTNYLGPIRMTSALIEHLEAAARRSSGVYDVRPRLRATGVHGDLFIDQGGTALLYPFAEIPAAGQFGKSAGNRAPVGADGTDEQPGRSARDAA